MSHNILIYHIPECRSKQINLQKIMALMLILGKPSRIDIPLEDGMKVIGDRSPYIVNYKVGAEKGTNKIM